MVGDHQPGNSKIKINSAQVLDLLGHPVEAYDLIRLAKSNRIPPGVELAQLVDGFVEVLLGRAPLALGDPGVRHGLVHAQTLLRVNSQHLPDQVLGLCGGEMFMSCYALQGDTSDW